MFPMIAKVARMFSRLWKLPRLIRWHRGLLSAADDRDWAEVIRLGSYLHSNDLVSRQSRFLVGTAYLHVGDPEAAVRELASMEGRLRDDEDEARRHLNHAIALHALFRSSEAATLLRAQVSDRWPTQELEKARSMLDEIGHLAVPLQ